MGSGQKPDENFPKYSGKYPSQALNGVRNYACRTPRNMESIATTRILNIKCLNCDDILVPTSLSLTVGKEGR